MLRSLIFLEYIFFKIKIKFLEKLKNFQNYSEEDKKGIYFTENILKNLKNHFLVMHLRKWRGREVLKRELDLNEFFE